MKDGGFRYVFTLKELKYFLFAKKKCPKCGGELKQSKQFAYRTDLFHNSGKNPIYAPGAKVRQYYYSYLCKTCNSNFLLTELAK